MARKPSAGSVDDVERTQNDAEFSAPPQPDAQMLVQRLRDEVATHATLDDARRAYGLSLLDRLLNDLG